MSNLRRHLINWAATGRGKRRQELDLSETLAGLPADGGDALEVELVQRLNHLMQTTEGLTAALPQLYSAMVGASIVVRASAAAAVGELRGRQQDNLPDLVFERSALLTDPYRMVHQSAAHALEKTHVPEKFEQRARRD